MAELLTNVENPEQYDKLSVSELGTLLRCLKKHDYAYRQGLVPKEAPDYFTRGTYLHTVMELWLQGLRDGPEVGGLPLTDIFDQALWLMRDREKGAVTERDRIEINEMVKDFVSRIGEPDFTVEHVEVEFLVDLGWGTWTTSDFQSPFNAPVLFHGVIDGVIRDAGGDLWLLEHKTASRAWSQGQFNFNLQGPLYLEAWEALTGERPTGILYNFFYPRGRFETKEIYYGEDETWLVRDEVQKALQLRDSGMIVRQPAFGCNDCGYKDVCFAELRGQDSSLTRDIKFTVDMEKKGRFDTA